jgi:hypothetical protein
MSVRITNPSTEAAVRKLAALRGVSLTQAVDQAVREALGRTRATRTADTDSHYSDGSDTPPMR